jgi:hypothetical protein
MNIQRPQKNFNYSIFFCCESKNYYLCKISVGKQRQREREKFLLICGAAGSPYREVSYGTREDLINQPAFLAHFMSLAATDIEKLHASATLANKSLIVFTFLMENSKPVVAIFLLATK